MWIMDKKVIEMPQLSDGQRMSEALVWNRLIESVPASYVVWKDGTTYYAECLLKDGTDYSGTDASTIIQDAIDALGTVGGKIFIRRGQYALTKIVTVPSKIIIEGEGRSYIDPESIDVTCLADNSSFVPDSGESQLISIENAWGTKLKNLLLKAHIGPIISIIDSHGIVLEDLTINGCQRVPTGLKISATVGGGIYASTDIHLRNCLIHRCLYGVDIDGYTTESGTGQVTTVYVESGRIYDNRYGLNIKDASGVNLDSTIVEANLGHGVIVQGTDKAKLTNVHFENNGRDFPAEYTIKTNASADSGHSVDHLIVDKCRFGSAILTTEAKLLNVTRGYFEKNWFHNVNVNLNIDASCSDIYAEDNYFRGTITGTINHSKGNIGYVTENSGNNTGTGAQQTIAHGLVSTPKLVTVIPNVTGATVSSVWADATNIYCTVTNGKTYNWVATVQG